MKKISLVLLVISSLLFSCKKEVVEPTQVTQSSKSVVIDTTNPVDSTNSEGEGSVGYLVFVIDLGLIDMGQPLTFTVFKDYDHSTSTGTLLPIDTSDLVIENSQGTFIMEVNYDDSGCDQFSLRLDEATYSSSTVNDVDIYFKLHKDGVPNNINFVYYNNMGVGGFTTSECYE